MPLCWVIQEQDLPLLAVVASVSGSLKLAVCCYYLSNIVFEHPETQLFDMGTTAAGAGAGAAVLGGGEDAQKECRDRRILRLARYELPWKQLPPG